MVHIGDGLIQLHTKDTSYILHAVQDGDLQNLHYGGRIKVASAAPLLAKAAAGYGCEVRHRDGAASLANLPLDISGVQRGDVRSAALLARMPHGGYTSDFGFRTAVLQKGGEAPTGGMPHGRRPDEVVTITMAEQGGLTAELFYSVFYEANVITRRMRVTNQGEGTAVLQRAFSYQLDLPKDTSYTLVNLTGAWAREGQVTTRPLTTGTYKFGSGLGPSGNRCNPFFFIAANDATEHNGDVYGFNLVYSGSHEGSVEVDSEGRMRVMHGIWSDAFEWELNPGESFVTPEAVLTFSDKGKNGMSHNMHRFVRRHILPPRWQSAPRPVLVNNWEGTYFRFTEAKLLSMAKTAAKVGIELFVLDDGWYGQRNNDSAGLGDYTVNRKKLPGGLDGLARKLNALGLDFGLWFEPEMVNINSDLYRAHPDWIVKTPGYTPAQGRHQYVLDFTRQKVREYVIRMVNSTLDSANIKYVKWDMNRNHTDQYSLELQGMQGRFTHSFTLGLYQVFENVCRTHPDILFEGCASGGNRFDLGVLYYMPQIWTSDNTDAHERQKIQTGMSYGYPQCTMGCHVSAVPNHQTLRDMPLDTRFNTAMFGVLGYELDLSTLSDRQTRDITAQIAYYKKHRELLQYGDFYRLKSPFEVNGCRWIVVGENKAEALAGDFWDLLVPNGSEGPMRLAGLDPHTLYNIQVRRQKISLKVFGGLVNYLLPVHVNPNGRVINGVDKALRLPTENEQYTAYGDLLCKAGFNRYQTFSGAGFAKEIRLMTDFASRVYYLCAIENKE